MSRRKEKEESEGKKEKNEFLNYQGYSPCHRISEIEISTLFYSVRILVHFQEY